MSAEADGSTPADDQTGHHHLDREELAHVIADERDEHTPAPEISARAAQLTGEQPPMLLEVMGGPLGMAEASIPSLAFVIAVTAGSDTEHAAIIAVGIALFLGVIRAIRRQTVQFALTGVIGVAFSAYVASKTGQPRNFFLPGFLFNVGYATIAFGSVAIRRPFIGYVVDGFTGNQGDWRNDPIKYRRFRTVSFLWGGIFVLRLAVQLPLYFTDQLVALGTAKIAMSYPLFGIGVWLSWLMLRTPKGAADAGAADAADEVEADATLPAKPASAPDA